MWIKTNNKKGYEEIFEGDGLDLSYAISKTRRGRVCHGMAHTLTGGGNECVVIKIVGNYSPSGYKATSIVDSSGIAPTVRENHGQVTRTIVKGKEMINSKDYIAYDEQNGCARTDGTVGTLQADGSSPKHNNRIVECEYRVRKLTPKECWRLMGFTDEDFEKAQAVNSNSQLYKQAGNSIVVNVLMAIFNQLTENAVQKTELTLWNIPQYVIRKPVRLIELFRGIGSQAKALKNLGWNFETYRVIEWDKFCIKSYNAVHGTEFGTQDISKTKGEDLGIEDTDKYDYIMTYSFPCQDLSVRGKGKGMKKGDGTRSGLLWEVERLLNECEELPQVLVMENVPQVHGKKNLEDFENWMEFLESKGYSNHWKDLNAKDYGIPQNRNRCFMVSLLGNYDYEFPSEIELQYCLGDFLEEEVDERYYLNESQLQGIINQKYEWGKYEHRVSKESEVANTLTRHDSQDPRCVEELAKQ